MSKQTGMSVGELMKIFYFNRLAARVFTKDPDGWLIKGGQALLVRYRGAARLSQDIDLQSTALHLTAPEVRQLVIDAATFDLGDFLRYAPTKYTDATEGGRGGAQHFKVFLGTTEVANIKVDLVVGRPLTGTAEVRTLKSAVDPGYTATDLNGNTGHNTVEDGADIIVRMALIGADGPTGGFFDEAGPAAW